MLRGCRRQPVVAEDALHEISKYQVVSVCGFADLLSGLLP